MVSSEWSLMRVVSHQGLSRRSLSSGWSFIRVVSHQGLSRRSLSSGWSLIRWSLMRVVSHQGLSSRRSLIKVSHQGGLSSGWFLIRVVSQHLGGFHRGDLSSRRSYIRVICHQVGLIRLIFHPGGFSSRVLLNQIGLSPTWSFICPAHIAV